MNDDRRVAPRYPVQMPLELAERQAQLRDISMSGVYFETDRPIAPGATIEFAFTLQNPEGPPLRLICKGSVVRVEEKSERIGVAATISDWQMIESG